MSFAIFEPKSSNMASNRPRRLFVIKARFISYLLSTKVLAFSALTILGLTLLFGFTIAIVYLSALSSSTSSGASRFHITAARVLDHNNVMNFSTHLMNVTHPPHLPRAILMSCPVGHSDVNNGKWKPSNMARGVEAVIQQLVRTNSSLPLYYAFYEHERYASETFCRTIATYYKNFVNIFCFLVPDKYPSGQYGYGKIFALRHVPVDEVLWLDCDMFPLRDLRPLFHDEDYLTTGAMFWADSRDFFDEYALLPVLHSKEMRTLFPHDAWWVRQGFDSGIMLINRSSSEQKLSLLCKVARAPRFKVIRGLSMGDKDLFHLVWMMHRKNFTLSPYIGETGSLQPVLKTTKRKFHDNRINDEPYMSLSWQMSSQVKYGRDGLPYAMHQLHRSSWSRSTHITKNGVSVSNRPSLTYIAPALVARKDLRFLRGAAHTGDRRKYDTFVEEVERTLIDSSRKVAMKVDDANKLGVDSGLSFATGSPEFSYAAHSMNLAWSNTINTEAVVLNILNNIKRREERDHQASHPRTEAERKLANANSRSLDINAPTNVAIK